KRQLKSESLLATALSSFKAGLDPSLIELPETAVFPYLIPVAPSTARKSRCTGILLGRPAPRYVKRGRTVSYRLRDALDWLMNGDTFNSTADFEVSKLRQPPGSLELDGGE